ncbi:hypothetical protein KKF82_04245 [Patescibacteria group bacterium]|nr:hypothetical protein [Patescibacteria group bacterium]
MKQVKDSIKKSEESLSYTVEVTDKEGRVLQRISAPSRCYVEQWNKLLNVQAKQTNLTIKDTSGNNQDIPPSSTCISADAGIGNINTGFRVGKGTTAVDITNYALGAPCGEGTGEDEFNHQQMQWSEPSVAGSDCSFKLWRVMSNQSGATITGIKELGCHVHMTGLFALAFRDVLPSAVYVPHGGAITVTYTIKVTV